ncbi:uncharacterized protein KZ484_021847 [Pholidichthys leucotaenia]
MMSRSNSPEPDSSGTSRANAVSVKLPEFWQDNPDSWFLLVEAQFALGGITADDTKFYHVIAKLDSRTARHVQSLVQRPPAGDKYGGLKAALIQRFPPSAQERAERLLALNDLGESTPVDLMEDMLRLRGSDDNDFLFAHIFLRTLPSEMKATLAGSRFVTQRDFRALAQEAQRILNASRRHTATAAAADLGATTGNGMGPEAAEADPPTTAVVKTKHCGGDDLCFYHHRLAERARKCIPPCQFKSSGNAGAGKSVAAAALGEQNKLLYLKEARSGRQFLVDTGSQVSFITPTYADRLAGPGSHGASVAKDSSIKTFGERKLLLSLHGRTYEWTFIIAAVSFNMLGADFLCSHGLLVDLPNRRLVNALSFYSIPCAARVTPPTAQANVATAGGKRKTIQPKLDLASCRVAGV